VAFVTYYIDFTCKKQTFQALSPSANKTLSMFTLALLCLGWNGL
jgi:hypothetical protein